MTKTPAVRGLLAGFVLLVGSVTQAFAQAPSPAQMLDSKLAPKLEDVQISVPAPDELKGCTVELVQGTVAKSNGWLLKDAKGQPLRRYFDSNGDGKIDTWSYFKDGVEVYREFDSTFNGTANNFRWLNAGGMKWGVGSVDARGKGVITGWRMISAEEVGFEAFQAVAKNDFARLHTLLITDAEMQMIKLPAAKIKAVAAIQQQAQQKFINLVQTTKLAGVNFDGVEGATPNCETTGDVEIIKFPSRAIRYVVKKNQHAWIHTGEMIQVGMAWRIVDVPSEKDGSEQPNPNKIVAAGNPQLQKLLNALSILDMTPPPSMPILAKDARVRDYYSKRIDLVRQIIPLDKDSEVESWYKQIFDNMTALAQNNGDDATMTMLTQMKDGAAASTKLGPNVAAYGAYREMWTRYAVGMARTPDTNTKEITKLQDKWLDDLSDFVKRYPSADDTADSLGQLAVGCEFGGKIEEAKRWYTQLFDNYPKHQMAQRAHGSVDRLNLVGSPMKLTAPLLNDSGKTFNVADLKGKVVIVHYWSSAASTYENDFAILKRIMEQNGAKNNVELVCISLDEDAAKARQAIAKAGIPGIHLFLSNNNANGLNSPLATQYGIHILPTIFVVDRKGVVRANAVQIGDIDTELKKVQ
jgi:peroxiredoxin